MFGQTQRFPKGRLTGDEIEATDDGHRRVVDAGGSFYSRQFYQRALECTSGPRPASVFRGRPTMADAFIDSPDASPLYQPSIDFAGRATGLALIRALVPSGANPRRAHAPPIPGRRGRWGFAPDQQPIARNLDPAGSPLAPCGGVDGRYRLGGRVRRLQKKETKTYTAHRAGMGQRTFKTGQSRWYVGYKKHTLRLWWREHEASVLLVPLVSWITPANFYDGALLIPSLQHCRRQWQWWPKIIVADMAYMGAELKAHCRTLWNVAVVTRSRLDMQLMAPYVDWNRTECHQGQSL